MNYSQFFKKATGDEPYAYQSRLVEAAWPTVLAVPTGMGKTAVML